MVNARNYFFNMKSILCMVCCVLQFTLRAQVPDTVALKLREVDVHSRDYQQKYNKQLRRVRKVYPLALHAAELVRQFDADLDTIDSKRQQKKYSKQAHEMLKDDYTFVIRDLYVEEGILLMKLIHRETGMTVAEIIRKYRGKMRSELYDNLGKIWEQDLDIKYDATGADKITEAVIRDIQLEKIDFDPAPHLVTKEEYKVSRKQYKIDKKASKKAVKSAKASRKASSRNNH